MITNERQELIGRFCSGVNKNRSEGGYKIMPVIVIAAKLAHLETRDLYFMIKKCENSNNFGKVFWGELKNR